MLRIVMGVMGGSFKARGELCLSPRLVSSRGANHLCASSCLHGNPDSQAGRIQGAYWVKLLPPDPARLCVNVKAALLPLVMGLSSPPAGKFSYLWDRDHSPHRTHSSASPALCGGGMVFLREGMTKTNHFPALSPTTPPPTPGLG